MKGTIRISGVGHAQFDVQLNVDEITRFEKLAVIDGLTDVFELSKMDRLLVGYTIMRGGLKAVTGCGPTSIKIDIDTLEKAKQMLQDIETDTQ